MELLPRFGYFFKSCPWKCGVCQMDISKTEGGRFVTAKSCSTQTQLHLRSSETKRILRPPQNKLGWHTHKSWDAKPSPSPSMQSHVVLFSRRENCIPIWSWSRGTKKPLRKFEKNRSGKVGISQVVSLHQNLTNSFLHWTLFPIWWLISYLPINSWIHLESRQNLGPEHEQF